MVSASNVLSPILASNCASAAGWKNPDPATTSAIAENVYPPVRVSASMSMFSKAHHFNVGGSIHMNSTQHIHNAQGKLIDGMIIEHYRTHLFR
jgi:hypothetical protein